MIDFTPTLPSPSLSLSLTQSYGVDEQLSQDNVTSPKRLLSHRGSRKRHHSGSESERGAERQLSKQASINREASVTEGVITKADQEKKQEEWDKDIPEVLSSPFPLLACDRSLPLTSPRPLPVPFSPPHYRFPCGA